MRIPLAALLACACAASTTHADPLTLDSDSLRGFRLVVVPTTAADLTTARDAGLLVGYMPWGGGLVRVPRDPNAGPEPSPFHGRQRLDLLDPNELLGIQGIPVMLEGTGAVGIMPYVSVQTTTVGANPVPYPDVPPATPELVAHPTRSGWQVVSVRDGSEHALSGIAPAHWTIDGVDVAGIGVLVDANGTPGALLGQPVLDDGAGAALASGVHLVHL